MLDILMHWRVQPSSKNPIARSTWYIKASLQENEEAIQKVLNNKGKFSLATNDLDVINTTDSSIITRL